MMLARKSISPKSIFAVLLMGFIFSNVLADEPSVTPPTPNYKFGFSERFRIETWDNSTSLNNSANAGSTYTRNRSIVMGQWLPNEKLEFSLKLANEFRSYMAPTNKQFNIDEVFVDQLYFKWKNIGGTPATLVVGRTNMMFGEGFVIMDGGPLDGSRSGYFNAIRADYQFEPKVNLTAFYSTQHRTDDFLPVINDKSKPLTDQHEKAGALYFDGTFASRNLQAYYIRKDAKSITTKPKSEINAIGVRTQSPIIKNLSLTFEWAYEFGKMGSAELSAFGGYTYLTWQTGWPQKNPLALTLGSVYLSGDNPGSTKYEGWDPLYGRWPKWSESYIYTLSKEGGVAYWTNLYSLYGRAQIDIFKNVRFLFDYHHLMAPHAPLAGLTFPGGNGKHRGELGIAKLTYQINKMVSGQLIWENFNPGSYYFSGADAANWMRIEFMINL
jgi:hypothetical protein